MSKAADMLNISQPALGSNIRRLEIELGVPLFDRVGRNIVLNSYGEEFLKSANSIIDIWSEATIKLKSMRDDNSNTVTFRMPSLSNFDALQQTIYEKYPKCILVNDDFYFEELESLLLDGKLDFCITGRAIESEKIIQKKISTTRNAMLVKSTSPYAAYERANVADFKDALFVTSLRIGHREYPNCLKFAMPQDSMPMLCLSARASPTCSTRLSFADWLRGSPNTY